LKEGGFVFPLIIASVILITGLGSVALLLWNEKRLERNSNPDENYKKLTGEPQTDELLSRLGFSGDPLLSEDETRSAKSSQKKSGLFSFLNPSRADKKSKDSSHTPEGSRAENTSQLNIEKAQGTATLRLDSTDKNDFSVATELSLQVDELRTKIKEIAEKYEKLNNLFKEKSIELDKTRSDLAVELRNRKEFNKVKDILEKELKDSREKSRLSQNEVTAATTETQSHLKRVTQLEERIKKLEKEIRENEDKAKQNLSSVDAKQQLINELQANASKSSEIIADKDKKIKTLIEHFEHPKQTPAASTPETKPDEMPVNTVPPPAAETPKSEPMHEDPPALNIKPVAKEEGPIASPAIPDLSTVPSPMPTLEVPPKLPASSEEKLSFAAEVEAQLGGKNPPEIKIADVALPKLTPALDIAVPAEDVSQKVTAEKPKDEMATPDKKSREDMTTKSLLQTIEQGIKTVLPPINPDGKTDKPAGKEDRPHLAPDIFSGMKLEPQSETEIPPETKKES